MKLHVITTGGTIDKIYFDAKSQFQVGPPMVAELLRDANVTLAFTVESLFSKDSLDLTDADRQQIRSAVTACSEDRVLITHGTDTMAETARALTGIPGKTIVLTGSLQPARFRSTDAVFNIGFAIGAAECLPPGVYIAMNGRVFDSSNVVKNRDRQCFEEIN